MASNLQQDRRWNFKKPSATCRTLVDNKTVDHSDVIGASPVGTAPTTSSFSTSWLQRIRQRQLQDESRDNEVLGFGVTYSRGLTVYYHTYQHCNDIVISHFLSLQRILHVVQERGKNALGGCVDVEGLEGVPRDGGCLTGRVTRE